MTNAFISSLNDRFTQLDSYITKIWNAFTSMISTITKYVKYFLRVAFKSVGYVIGLFTFVFIMIMLFSKERKENLYVLAYFFIGFTMVSVIVGMIAAIIKMIELIIQIYNNIVKLTHPGRSARQKAELVGWIFAFIFACVGLGVALFIGLAGLSFLYSFELDLYDKIEIVFKDLMN